MLYKIQNSLVDIDNQLYIKQSDPRTRGNRVHQERAFHPAITNTFFPRTKSDWNQLPTTATSAPSLDSFHARLSHNQLWASMGGP